MESEICTKMLRNLSEKLEAKFPFTTIFYSMVKISKIFELETSRVEVQSVHHKHKKKRKKKGKKYKLEILILYMLDEKFCKTQC